MLPVLGMAKGVEASFLFWQDMLSGGVPSLVYVCVHHFVALRLLIVSCLALSPLFRSGFA